MAGTADSNPGCMPIHPILMDNPQKILVIQLKRAGDVLLTTPVPKILRLRWPEARIDFLTDPPFAPLLALNPTINVIHQYDKNNRLGTIRRIRSEGYDL